MIPSDRQMLIGFAGVPLEFFGGGAWRYAWFVSIILFGVWAAAVRCVHRQKQSQVAWIPTATATVVSRLSFLRSSIE